MSIKGKITKNAASFDDDPERENMGFVQEEVSLAYSEEDIELVQDFTSFPHDTPQKIRWIFMEIYGSPQQPPIKKAALTRSRSCPDKGANKVKIGGSRAKSKPFQARTNLYQGCITGNKRASYRLYNGYRSTIEKEGNYYENDRPLVPRYPLVVGCGEEVECEDGLIGLSFIEE